jgi:UDP-N-acetylmuramoyl-tripeptide--D-alanyl-D-alanine ligase
MLRFVLDRQGGASANGGNNNNIPGVQRTMASTAADLGYCVLEMGFGNPPEGIGTSADQMRPHVAVLTNVEAAHLDVVSGGDPLDEIAGFKSRIFRGLEPDGVAVVGLDHERASRVMELARQRASRVVGFGAAEGADVRLVDADLRPDGSDLTLEIGGDRLCFSLSVVGRHMAINAAGVIAAVEAVGADVEEAARALGEFTPVHGRAAIGVLELEGGQATIIDDSFNATPASVASSLDLLSVVQPSGEGRRVAVLGDILHLGRDAARLHVGLRESIERNRVDILFTHGSLMASLREAVPADVRGSHTESLRELYERVRECLRPGDVVTLKSGRGRGGLGDRGFLRLAGALRGQLDPSSLDG